MIVRRTTRDELRRVAAETFGWSQLRDEQLRAMEQVMSGHDVLVVLPTGAGKSAIYQVPALLLDGPTLVVSPLIALQRDQLEGIEDTRAPEAVAVNSTQRGGEHKQAWEAIRQGEAEYVFLSPEQLAKDSKAPGEALGEVVHALQEHDQPIRPAQLKGQVTASATQRTRAVNLLEQAGAVGTTSDGQLEYVDRQYLLGYFGEQLAHPCRNCDTCEAGTAEEQPARDDEFPRGRSV